MKHAVLLAILTVFLSNGCRRPQQGGTIIARVGDEVLTLEQANTSIDTTADSFEHQVNNYVSLWVTNELLYQEARRRGIQHAESFRRQIAEVERQLTIQQFLQEQLFADTSGITEDTLRAYFQRHTTEFFVREDMMKLNLIAFSTRERASAFAATVSRGSPWELALRKVLSDTTASSALVSTATNKYYSQRTIFPPELWKVSATLSVSEVSFPVKTALGYFVLQLLATVEQGKPAQFELVHDEVWDRTITERRRQLYEDLLGTLRKRYSVEEMLSLGSQPDTARIQPHE